MSEVFSARLNTRTNVKTAVDGLPFKAPGERYTVDDAHRLHLGLKRILTGTFNPAGGGTGMAALLRSSTDALNPSELAAVKSTDTAVAATIIQKKLEADKDAAKAAGKKADDVPPIRSPTPTRRPTGRTTSSRRSSAPRRASCWGSRRSWASASPTRC